MKIRLFFATAVFVGFL